MVETPQIYILAKTAASDEDLLKYSKERCADIR
jgi:hypothetical protein